MKKQRNIIPWIIVLSIIGIGHAHAQMIGDDNDPAGAFFDNSNNRVLHDLNLPEIPTDKNLYAPPTLSNIPNNNTRNNQPAPLSMSSGIVLSPDGPILTTADQLNNCKYIKVATPNGTQLNASTVAIDPASDLAIISAPIHGAWPIRVRGMPFHNEVLEVTGYKMNNSNLQISSGHATNQNKQTGTYTIEDADLNTSPGGAVLDGYGDLAGIITHTGSSVQAIPGNTIGRFLYANHVTIPVADGMISPVARVARETPNQIVVRIGCFQ